jgi:hypothetical protein
MIAIGCMLLVYGILFILLLALMVAIAGTW